MFISSLGLCSVRFTGLWNYCSSAFHIFSLGQQLCIKASCKVSIFTVFHDIFKKGELNFYQVEKRFHWILPTLLLPLWISKQLWKAGNWAILSSTPFLCLRFLLFSPWNIAAFSKMVLATFFHLPLPFLLSTLSFVYMAFCICYNPLFYVFLHVYDLYKSCQCQSLTVSLVCFFGFIFPFYSAKSPQTNKSSRRVFPNMLQIV